MRSFFRKPSSASPYLGPDRHSAQGSFGADGRGQPAAPFLLEYRSRDVQPDGSFRPGARVSISPNLGASGLLGSIGSDDLASLLLVLSSVTPGGGFVATPEILAPQLGISRVRMQRRLERLASLRWQGWPLVTAVRAESGLRLFAPSSHLFEAHSSAVIPISPGQQARDVLPSGASPLPPSRREESVARSRELYARPRAEVEGEIERFLSGASPYRRDEPAAAAGPIPKPGVPGTASTAEVGKPDNQQASEGRRWLALKKRLFAVGLSHAQAQTLLDGYPFDLIERQLEWLPRREARSPVAYLLAAVAGDYAPPRSLPAAAESESPADDDSATGTAADLKLDD